MDKQPAKINIARQFLKKTKAKLEAILHFAAPDEKFRFVTFEGDDYAEHKLTMLLFDFLPDRVFVTVPRQCNLPQALEEVRLLNAGIHFEAVNLSYFDKADIAKERQTQELKIIYPALQVDAEGRLVQLT